MLLISILTLLVCIYYAQSNAKIEHLQTYVNQITKGNQMEMFEGLKSMKFLVNSHIQQVLDIKILPQLLNIITEPQYKDKTELLFQTVWIVSTIASGTSEQTFDVVESGGIEAFVKLMHNTKNVAVIIQCIRGLSNIAEDGPRMRDLVLKTDVLDYALKLLESPKLPILAQRNIVGTLSNFCHGKPSPEWRKVSKLIVPLVKLIQTTKDYDTIINILWSINFITEKRESKIDEESMYGEKFQIEAVIQTNVIPFIFYLVKYSLELITSGNPQKVETGDLIMEPCIGILGNIAVGTDTQTQCIIDNGFIDIFEPIIQHTKISNIKKELCWGLSNIAAGTTKQQNAIFDNPSVIQRVSKLLLDTKQDFKVRKEAAWILSNLIDGALSFEQIQLLEKHQFLEAMISFLNNKNIADNKKLISMTIESIEALLNAYKEENLPNKKILQNIRKLGGVKTLKSLQEKHNCVKQFLTKYFE